MKRRGSDLDPELEAFLTPCRSSGRLPPELRARVLARARATVAAGGASPAAPLCRCRRRRGCGPREVAVCFGSRSRRRLRWRPARSERRRRSTAGRAAPRGPGRSVRSRRRRSDHERRQSVERTALVTATPAVRGRPAPPRASRRENGPVQRRARSAAAGACCVHAARLLGRAGAGRGARAPVPERAPRRAARSVARAIPRGLRAYGRSASCRGCVRDPISPQCSAAAGCGRLGIREAVIVRRQWPAGLGRRSPSIVAGAVWTRSPRGAFDRPARIRGGPRLSRRRGLQGRRHRPAGLRPLHRKRARARAGPHRAADRGHRRTHRVARCERQVGRRAGVPVGEHRLSPPGARDGLALADPDSAPGKG